MYCFSFIFKKNIILSLLSLCSLLEAEATVALEKQIRLSCGVFFFSNLTQERRSWAPLFYIKMELIRSKSLHFDKYSQLKRPQTYGKKSDQLLIEKLRSDNVHIKHRLIELENELLKSKESKMVRVFDLGHLFH